MNERFQNLFLLLLSLAAGCIDASAFVRCGAFPANMTGNSVLLGLAFAKTEIGPVWLSILALLGFCLGVLLAGIFLKSPLKNDPIWPRRLALLFFGESLVLLGAAAADVFLSEKLSFCFLLAAAVAMGLQAAAVLRIAVPGISTTVITGTLASGLLRLLDRSRNKAVSVPPGLNLPLLSWTAYLLGAVLGGWQSVHGWDALLILPGCLVAAVGIGYWKNFVSRP